MKGFVSILLIYRAAMKIYEVNRFCFADKEKLGKVFSQQ